MFAEVEEMQGVELAPSGTVAVVEYDHAVDARKAFRGLAYRRFHHVPLYLEWAPMRDHPLPAPPKEEEKEDEEEVEDDGDNLTTSVFVKNLNFKTTEEDLRLFFQKKCQPRSVKITTKVAPDGKKQSMGFGFVEFCSYEQARDATKSFQGLLLRGHALRLALSNKTPPASSQKKPKHKKIMIRNVPFQADKAELAALFGNFGQLKRIRMPKRFDGRNRGFAFVEFLTPLEARKAFDTLKTTHFYGRHLVLEWAEEEQDVEALRERAKKDVAPLQWNGKKITFPAMSAV